MFLSMIIPVYNTEKYLAECLDSCLDQDISDYEIICVNDGSRDGSLALLREYESRHQNIIVIDQPNAGVSAARNAGMDAARGEYVWFIDSDDLIAANCLGHLLEQSRDHACDTLAFQMYLFNDVLTPEEERLLQSGQLSSNTTFCAQPNMLIRRAALGDIRWPEGIEVGEDSIFLREFSLKMPVKHQIDRLFYLYRQHADSAVHSARRKTTPSRLRSHVRGAIIMRDIYCSPNGQCEANANYLMMFLVYAMTAIASNYNRDARDALRTLKREKLFPFSRPPECTKTDAFISSNKNAVGRILNLLCLYSHTRIGFFLLRVWYLLYNLIKK